MTETIIKNDGALISSNSFGFVLRSDKTLWGRGSNSYGQLGNGGTASSGELTQVMNLSDVKMVTAGDSSAYALKQDGTVWSWGRNVYYSLGDGTDEMRTTPVQLIALKNIVQISSGDTHVLAVESDGTVWAWGRNYYGQVGDGSNTDRPTPYKIPELSNIKSVAAGNSCSFAMRVDGAVFSWGYAWDYNSSASPKLKTDINSVAQISAISSGLLALKEDNTLWSWGGNAFGELGDGTTEGRNAPAQIMSNVVQISGNGKRHALALKQDRTVWSWGEDGYAALGREGDPLLPMQVLSISDVKQIYSGDYDSHALKEDSSIWAWGLSKLSGLTDFTYEPALSLIGSPIILPPSITLSPSTTNMTNQDIVISVTIASDENISVKKYATGGQTTSYFASNGTTLTDNTFAASSNNTYTVYAKDISGNEAVKTITISNIDKIAPVPATLSASVTTPTNQNVPVTIMYPSDGLVKEYKIGVASTWIAYTTPILMTTNGTVYARSTDEAGNISEESSLVINNIDKSPPANATFTASTTNPTNENVILTISYPSDASIKQYKVGAGEVWSTYTAPVIISFNNTVYARSYDEAGNVSSESNYIVSNIDKTPPGAPSMTPSSTTWTNNNVTITISYPSGTSIKQYRINDGAWTNYITVVVVTENGVVESRGANDAGSDSPVASLTVGNIDKVAPIASLSPSETNQTNKDIIITLTSTDNGGSGIAVRKWANGNQNATFFASGGTTLTGSTFTVSTNGTYTVYVKDNAGNETIKTIAINNIDKNAPSSPAANFSVDTLTITFGVDVESAAKTFIKIGDDDWILAPSKKVFVDGTYHLVLETRDEAGNVSNQLKLTVNAYGQALKIANDALNKAKDNPTEENISDLRDAIGILPDDVRVDFEDDLHELEDLTNGEGKNAIKKIEMRPSGNDYKTILYPKTSVDMVVANESSGEMLSTHLQNLMQLISSVTLDLSVHKQDGNNPHGTNKTQVGLGNVTNDKQLPIAGGQLAGVVKAQDNTSYTTPQLRNITISTADPSGGKNGDLWFKYV